MNPITHPLGLEVQPWLVSRDGIPILYEEEEEAKWANLTCTR